MNSLLNFLIPKKINLSLEIEKPEIMQNRTMLLTAAQQRSLRILCARVAIASFEHYSKQNLKQFDPLVGENSCQIRGYKLLEMHRNQEVDRNHLIDVINRLQKMAELLLKEDSFNEQDQLNDLTDKEKYLISCHLLTCIRDSQNRQTSNELQLNQFTHVPLGESILKEIVFHCKKNLSSRSVKDVQKLGSKRLLFKKLLFQVEDSCGQGLKCTALFYNLQVLLFELKQNRSLLMLNIANECTLFFRANHEGQIQLIQDVDSVVHEPAFVVFYQVNDHEKMSSFIEFLKASPNEVEEFICADAADHPLFAGKAQKKKLEIYNHPQVKPFIKICKDIVLEDEVKSRLLLHPNQKELRGAESVSKPTTLLEVILAHRHYKNLKRMGKENKKILQIAHIYCNIVGKEMGRENKQ